MGNVVVLREAKHLTPNVVILELKDVVLAMLCLSSILSLLQIIIQFVKVKKKANKLKADDDKAHRLSPYF